MSDLRTLYPAIEPYESGMFDMGDGHRVYYERVGTPGMKPAIFVHGGPGAGISEDHRRLFDPDQYDILLFDQRGCGKSIPHASTHGNTTWHLVADMERFREYVGAGSWLVFGGSWGSTLSLAYAQKHPERVSELVLRGIFLGDQKDLDWFYQFGASEIFPDRWDRFVKPIPLEERADMIAAYAKRLESDIEAVQLEAARAWSLWEGATVSLLPNPEREASCEDTHYALAVARIENHFFKHGCWLEPGQLLRDANRLADIPCTIIHGRYDICCSAGRAWALHKAMPHAQLHIIEGAGHVFSEAGILDQLLRATDGYAGNV
jgi:proline iminopeptidase